MYIRVHAHACIHCTCISQLHNVWIDTWPFDYHILHTALTEVGIFRLPGQASRIHTLKETYDCGSQKDFSTTEDIHTVASLLKLYLRELPEPVIPHVYYESFKQATRCEKLGKKLALYMYKIGWLHSLMNYVLFTRNLKQYRLSQSCLHGVYSASSISSVSFALLPFTLVPSVRLGGPVSTLYINMYVYNYMYMKSKW